MADDVELTPHEEQHPGIKPRPACTDAHRTCSPPERDADDARGPQRPASEFGMVPSEAAADGLYDRQVPLPARGQEPDRLADRTRLTAGADIDARGHRYCEPEPESGLPVKVRELVRLGRLPAQVAGMPRDVNSHFCSP
jgi:hypothetical protein